jgi:hypothetical protein
MKYVLFALLIISPSLYSAVQRPHCKAGDPVVWLNTKSNVVHLQGDKYYGHTKHGRLLCKSTVPKGARIAKMETLKAARTKFAKTGPATPAQRTQQAATTTTQQPTQRGWFSRLLGN